MIKSLLILGAILFGLIGLFFFAKHSQATQPPASNSQRSTSMATITQAVANGGQLIDVRTAAEYAEGHITDAINLPLQDIQNGTLPTAAKDKPIYVYCRSGNRSSQAAELLKTAGYSQVIDLGAIADVQALGGTIEQ